MTSADPIRWSATHPWGVEMHRDSGSVVIARRLREALVGGIERVLQNADDKPYDLHFFALGAVLEGEVLDVLERRAADALDLDERVAVYAVEQLHDPVRVPVHQHVERLGDARIVDPQVADELAHRVVPLAARIAARARRAARHAMVDDIVATLPRRERVPA